MPSDDRLAPDELRVRMYRVGFGDCFLVSLPVDGGHRHVLVDCGVHAQGDIGIFKKVVTDIRAASGDVLSLVIVSHVHQDHISGFGTFASEFSQVAVGEIWLPWTENPEDAQARRLRNKQLALALQLRAHLRAGAEPEVEAVLQNVIGSEVRNAEGDLRLASNATSMQVARGGFKGAQRIRYLEAGAKVRRVARVEGLEVQVLGPPRDEKFLAKMDPPARQRWATPFGALAREDVRVVPFPDHRVTRRAVSRAGAITLARGEEEAVKASVTADEMLAFALDRMINNTSLVLLLRHRGVSMLFPGDAQWGNWAAWMNGAPADSLLAGLHFYKVGHHGSHNATPREAVDKMSNPELAAMISTQSSPWPSIPKTELLEALRRRAHRRIARSDWVAAGDAAAAPDRERLRKPFRAGPFWIDYVRKT